MQVPRVGAGRHDVTRADSRQKGSNERRCSDVAEPAPTRDGVPSPPEAVRARGPCVAGQKIRRTDQRGTKWVTLIAARSVGSGKKRWVSGSAASPAHADPQRWIDGAKWRRLQPGMSELEVIELLGAPTSMREEGGARVLLYALEIGTSGFLGGSVTLRDRVVSEVRQPALQ